MRKRFIGLVTAATLAIAPALAYSADNQNPSAPLPPAGAAGTGASSAAQAEPIPALVFLGALGLVGVVITVALALGGKSSTSTPPSTR